jgi:hypothetical protein
MNLLELWVTSHARLPLDGEKSIVTYLAGVQSFYEKAANGHPHRENIDGPDGYGMLLEKMNHDYVAVGYEILQSRNNGCGIAARPACAWGNYGYGSIDSKSGGTGLPNYSIVRDSNSDVLYCVTFRSFADRDDPNTATHPPDIWREDRFAITKTCLGTTSTYSYELTPGVPNNPPWLGDDQFVFNDDGEPVLARTLLSKLPTNCP